MSNTNGLIASSDVCATGSPVSNFFIRKGEPIAVPSPIQIISPNGAEVGSIAEDNNGVMTLTTDSNILLASGGAVLLQGAPGVNASLDVSAGGILNIVTPSSTVIQPGNGNAIVVADGGANKGLVVKPATEATGVASITLRNGTGATTPSYYTLYNSSVAGGGLTSGNLQLFGYSGAPTVIREILECNPAGSAISLGDASTVGGAVVTIQGASGAGRVYDTIYNTPPIPFAFNEIFTWTTDMTSGQNLSTFTLPATGLYMLYTYIDLTSASLATNSVNNFFTNFLLYGDPAHGALLTPGTNSQIASFSMSKAPSTNFGYVSTQIIMSLANNTYEPNQRYKFAKSQNGGYTGGTVTIKLYRLA